MVKNYKLSSFGGFFKPTSGIIVTLQRFFRKIKTNYKLLSFCKNICDMYISGHFFYDFELLDMSGQISYDFDEKLLNFNNSRQIHVFLFFSIFFVLFPSFVIFFVVWVQICAEVERSGTEATYL
jgi:hypothetical protein